RNAPRIRRSKIVHVLAALLALAMLAAACGDDGDGGGDADPPGGDNGGGPTTTAAPQSGGTLTFAAYQEIAGLDPIVALGSGTSGGIQTSAVYDTIMRYDMEKREYV